VFSKLFLLKLFFIEANNNKNRLIHETDWIE
jgi:hypothetical protein